MSDNAHKREERVRNAREKTASQLRELASRNGRSITQTEARERVEQAERKRGPNSER